MKDLFFFQLRVADTCKKIVCAFYHQPVTEHIDSGPGEAVKRGK